MNFIKYKLRKLNISKRKILTISLCLVIFVMSLGYAALSQHMDIDGIAQIDRSWIVKIVSITSSVTNDGVDTSHSFVGTTATLHASLPTTSATVKYEIVLENQGNITAKLSTIEKTEDTNYSITYEIEGVLEDTTVLKPGETNKVIVTIKAQDGVTNLSNTTKDLMLGFDYVEKSGNTADNNSGNSTDYGYKAYQPGDAIMFDPGDGTERLFYVLSSDDTAGWSNSNIDLIAAESIGTSTASEASTYVANNTSGWSKCSIKRLPTMEEIAKLSGYKMSQVDKHVTTGDNIIPEWLAGSQIGYTATSTRNGDKYYLVKNNGSDGGKVELGANSTAVSVRPIIKVYKGYLSPISYSAYEIGDKVTLVDGSIWYVAEKTGQVDSMVTLFSSTIPKTGVFDTTAGVKQYNPSSSTNIGYYIQNTYLPSIKSQLSTAGGNVTGMSARLPSADEAAALYLVDTKLTTTNGAPIWVMPSENNYTAYYSGLLSMESTVTGISIRPVITVSKTNITSVDLGYRITNVNNVAKADTNIDFSKAAYSSNSSLYRERQYYNNAISFTSSTTYYFGKSYTFNPTTGKYSLVGTTSNTWPNMSSNYSTYPYTCKSTSSTGTCSTLYKITSYTSSTVGAGYTLTYAPIERVYTEDIASSADSGFGYGSTSGNLLKYATSYVFDKANGEFILNNATSITWNDLPNKYTTYKYACSNNNDRCTTLYEIISGSFSGAVSSYTINAKSHRVKYSDNLSGTNGLGLYYTNTNTEDNKRTYYFRGDVENNYVSFANRTWRIIRVNEDGSVRLITQDKVDSGSFAKNDSYPGYTGYMYGDYLGTSYELEISNDLDSPIKTKVDSWYQNNLTNYSSYLADAGFCGDRSLSSGLGYGMDYTSYGTYNRLSTNKKPQFKCPQSNDLYTTKSATKGNKALTYPVGLITADEVVYGGGAFAATTYGKYYLMIGINFWTMSPSLFNSYAYECYVLDNGTVFQNLTYMDYAVRPVINIKPNVKTISGTGTSSNPYKFS